MRKKMRSVAPQLTVVLILYIVAKSHDCVVSSAPRISVSSTNGFAARVIGTSSGSKQGFLTLSLNV